MARNFEFIKDITDRKDLWKIAVKVKDKWSASKDGKEYFEMVVVDSKGDDIFLIVPNEFKNKYEKENAIVEKNTYSMQNFQVTRNEQKFKSSHHEFMLKFNGGTRVFDVNKHDIPDILKFKDFKDIIAEDFRENFLYDIIGAVDEIGYTQPHSGSKKIQVNLKIKDLSDNVIHCTFWENYATNFLNYVNNKTDAGPTVVCIKYAKVKKEGKYPLTVSNTWSTTKLFIDNGLPEIEAFKTSFIDAMKNGLISPVSETHSQISTHSYGRSYGQTYGGSQFSCGSQFTPSQKFYHNAEVMPFSQMLLQTQETKCVTIVNTIKVKSNKIGWCYLSCFMCPKQAFGQTPPYKCADDHSTETEIYRFKLDVEVGNGQHKATFVFWDQECAQLLNQSADSLHAQMIQAGINDPLDYPQVIDDIGGKTLAVKVKWQPNWKSGSVMAISEDREFILDVLSQFPTAEVANPQIPLPNNQALFIEDTTAQSVESDDNIVIPTVDLSATDEIDPDNVDFKTPNKTLGKTTEKVYLNSDADQLIGEKLSSTKLINPQKRPAKEIPTTKIKSDAADDLIGAKLSSTKIAKISKFASKKGLKIPKKE